MPQIIKQDVPPLLSAATMALLMRAYPFTYCSEIARTQRLIDHLWHTGRVIREEQAKKLFASPMIVGT